jgi:MFS family permease
MALGDSILSLPLTTRLGFLVIYAKLSDIFGTKLLILCAVTLFTIFSIACGFARTMLQLYVV